ncbi:MAG: hypothetical protein ACRCYO_02925, partial [Bacteroidia bacterium]
MVSSNKRFFYAWIAASTIMFLGSYLWHGVALNDYERIVYPRGIFMAASAVVYLFVGFLVSKVFTLSFMDSISRHPLMRGMLGGLAVGFLVYLITLVAGVGFNTGFDVKFMIMDVAWQCVEQALGGLAVGLVFMFTFVPVP